MRRWAALLLVVLTGCAAAVNPRPDLTSLHPPAAPGVIRDHETPAWTWSHRLDLDTLRSLFAVGDGVLVSETRRTWLLSATGRVRWSVPASEDVDWTADLSDAGVLVGQAPDQSAAYGITVRDRKDGRLLWRSHDAFVAVTDDGVLAFRGAVAVVLDARTGRLRWRLPGPDANHVPEVTASGGDVFAVEEGKVVRRAAATGRIVWSRPLSGVDDLLPGRRLLILTHTDGVTALDAATGRVAWTRRTAGGGQGRPIDATTTVVRAGDDDVFVDRSGRTVGRMRKTTGYPDEVAFTGAGGVHVLLDGQVYDAHLRRLGPRVSGDTIDAAFTGTYGITDRRITFTPFGSARVAWSLAVPPPAGLDALITDGRLCVPLTTGVRCYR